MSKKLTLKELNTKIETYKKENTLLFEGMKKKSERYFRSPQEYREQKEMYHEMCKGYKNIKVYILLLTMVVVLEALFLIGG
jgi:hypothetical protein